MGFALRALLPGDDDTSAWSRLPDIEAVTDVLSPSDLAFMSAVGQALLEVGQTSRFAVTLLHSHFPMTANEVLVEDVSEAEREIVTSARPSDVLAASANPEEALHAKSWLFFERCESHEEETLEVLTWTRPQFLRGEALRAGDALLLKRLATLYRSHGVTGRFGLALVGVAPADGFVWSEGPNQATRRLVQEQIEATNPRVSPAIKTMWQFDSTGRQVTTLGCCRRTRDGSGHTGSVHPKGW